VTPPRRRSAAVAARPLRLAQALLAGLALLTACGGATSGGPAAPTSSSASGSAGNFSAFRQCLAKHGVTVPARLSGRPTAGGSGGGTPGEGLGRGFENGTPSAQMSAALRACASMRPQGAFGAGVINASVLAAFRSCMTDHGVKIPIATPRSPAGGGPTPTPGVSGRPSFEQRLLGGLNPQDPGVAKALSVCRALLPARGEISSPTASTS